MRPPAPAVADVPTLPGIGEVPDQRPVSWPASRLAAAEIEERASILPYAHLEDREGLRGLRRVLAGLAAFPGASWQERWVAAGCDTAGPGWVDAVGAAWAGMAAHTRRAESRSGLGVLVSLDVIRPGYEWLHTARLSRTYQVVRELRDPEFVKRAGEHAERNRHPQPLARKALLVVSKVMLHTGKNAAEITPDDLLAYHRASWVMRGKADGVEYAWDLLAAFGGFPEGILSFRDYVRQGPMSVAEMIGFYQLESEPVAEMLRRYLADRAPALDYGTLRQLAYKLARVFWRDLEQHHPGISSLDLSEEVASGWKARVRASHTDPWPMFIAVRALYLDIAHWATHDAYWARWAARCPVGISDTRGNAKHRKRVQARMHQKVRSMTPQLPALLRSVDEQAALDGGLLAAAAAVPPGERFTYRGHDYEHAALSSMEKPGSGTYRGTGRIWIADLATGERVDLTRQEDLAFWAWAAINTFYYTGMRLEELAELTSTALFTYRLPDTGETLPLLQVAPSKSDAERVLIVPPELAHVLARVKQRVRGSGETVPLVTRYDPYERVLSPPLPFLFQRIHGTQRRVIAARHLADIIAKAITRARITGTDGEPVRLTPHDFRRVFATEAVSGGLPVHIVAKLLGHDSLTTTEAYTAIYPEDVVRHYRGFIARRRAARPAEEYRDPSDTEWEQFHQHFRRRKVELGNCGRGYSTPCQHEHACIRCPMLQPDPGQRARLEEIAENLTERLAEARDRGWLGEAEGIEVSISAAREKLARINRIVSLGIPSPRAPGREDAAASIPGPSREETSR
jgi:integrase